MRPNRKLQAGAVNSRREFKRDRDKNRMWVGKVPPENVWAEYAELQEARERWNRERA